MCGVTFAGFAGDDSQKSKQADLVDGQGSAGPGSVQTITSTALLTCDPPHEHHVTACLLVLLQPAHPS